MRASFVLRKLDGRFVVVLGCMHDEVSGRRIVEECYTERLPDATVFDNMRQGWIIDMIPDSYPYFLSGLPD